MKGRDSGSVSLTALVVLLSLSVLSVGIASVISVTVVQVKRSEASDREIAVLREAAAAVAQTLAADESPEIQSPLDNVHRFVEELNTDELKVELLDLSGKIGINWIRKEPLHELALALRSVADFQQYREDIGFRLDIAETYGEFFEPAILEEIFTPYSYWNINVSDEFTLEKLCSIRTGDEAEGQKLRSAVQSVRMQKVIVSPEVLSDVLGESYDDLKSVVTAEAPINVHFVDETVLDGIFRFYSAPSTIAQRIKSFRDGAEVTADWLSAALEDVENGPILLQYFGTKSWFWRIIVQDADTRLEWVVGRSIGIDEDEGGMVIQLLEESIEPAAER